MIGPTIAFNVHSIEKDPVGFIINFKMSVTPPMIPPTTGPNSVAVSCVATNETPIFMFCVSCKLNNSPRTIPSAINKAVITSVFTFFNSLAESTNCCLNFLIKNTSFAVVRKAA